MLTVQANNRLLREAHAEIKQIAPQRLLIAALDIGKDINVPHIVTGVGQTLLAPMKLSTLASGYQFFVGKLDQFSDISDLVLHRVIGGQSIIQMGALAHQLLRKLRIIPEIRVFGFGVEFV